MNNSPSRRFHAIDSLRALMITIVMVGHAMLPYVTVPRRFKDDSTHVGFDVVGLFLYSFAMPLFFVTAGFAAGAMLHARGLQGLWRNRLQSILVPLIVAYVVLTPLTRAAYAFAAAASESGTIEAGIAVLMTGEWLRWGKAYHLWFLVSLLLYTALALGLGWLGGRLVGPRPALLSMMADALFTARNRLLWMSLLAAVPLIPAYVLYDGDATTLPMQLHLFSFFLLGWLLFAQRSLLDTMVASVWPPLLAALLMLPAAVWAGRLRWMDSAQPDLLVGVIAGAANGVMVAGMTLGMLGLFHARLDRSPSHFASYVSEASYWIFLIHFPLIIFTGGALSVLPLHATVKFGLTVLIVVPLVFATYHFGVKSTPLGRALKARGPATAGAPGEENRER